MFAGFALAALLWAAAVLRWSVLRRGKAVVVLLSIAVAAIAVVSMIADVRSMRRVRAARASGLSIHIISRGDWFQLRYSRGGVAFVTANELHVPAGSAVELQWGDLPAPSTAGGDCVEHSCIVEAGEHDVRFIRLWRPMWQRLHVVADPPERFERWFANEAQPARVAASVPGASLFDSAGCTYCHAIRGIAPQPWPWSPAPDLTHFAARATIAGTDVQNNPGMLSGWIVDSHGIKRSSQMPRNRLDGAVLHTLVAFLESLR